MGCQPLLHNTFGGWFPQTKELGSYKKCLHNNFTWVFFTAKHQVIPYEKIEEIILTCSDARTQALLAFQYGSGSRVGELVPYTHRKRVRAYHPVEKRKIWNGEIDTFKTEGILKSAINIQPDSISWTMPNFKSHTKFKEPFVLVQEEFLYYTIKNWLKNCGEQVFPFSERTARKLIKEEIYPLSSHSLRKSRGTHLKSIFDYDAYDIMKALGHTKVETSLYYVDIDERKRKMLKKFNKEEI